MRARRVGHRQTSGTAVRGIEAHFGRQELSSRSDENPIYGIAGDKPYAFAGPDGKQWERRLKGAWEESATIKASRDDTRRRSGATCGFPLDRPLTAGDPLLAFRSQSERSWLRSTPGNPSNKRDVHVLPRGPRAKPAIVSGKCPRDFLRRPARLVEKEKRDLSASGFKTARHKTGNASRRCHMKIFAAESCQMHVR